LVQVGAIAVGHFAAVYHALTADHVVEELGLAVAVAEGIANTIFISKGNILTVEHTFMELMIPDTTNTLTLIRLVFDWPLSHNHIVTEYLTGRRCRVPQEMLLTCTLTIGYSLGSELNLITIDDTHTPILELLQIEMWETPLATILETNLTADIVMADLTFPASLKRQEAMVLADTLAVLLVSLFGVASTLFDLVVVGEVGAELVALDAGGWGHLLK
jgi:hypothetical protein